jgi:hypothetical protein
LPKSNLLVPNWTLLKSFVQTLLISCKETWKKYNPRQWSVPWNEILKGVPFVATWYFLWIELETWRETVGFIFYCTIKNIVTTMIVWQSSPLLPTSWPPAVERKQLSW